MVPNGSHCLLLSVSNKHLLLSPTHGHEPNTQVFSLIPPRCSSSRDCVEDQRRVHGESDQHFYSTSWLCFFFPPQDTLGHVSVAGYRRLCSVQVFTFEAWTLKVKQLNGIQPSLISPFTHQRDNDPRVERMQSVCCATPFHDNAQTEKWGMDCFWTKRLLLASPQLSGQDGVSFVILMVGCVEVGGDLS